MSVLMIGITFLFHWCVCDISCQCVSWYCRTLWQVIAKCFRSQQLA